MFKNNLVNNLNTKISTESNKHKDFSTINNYATFQNASRFDEIKLITIGLASPDKVRNWAETKLPDGTILGQVYNANTLHHKTLKPLKGGLFCERIFGPTKDFQCSCGIQKEKPVSRIVHRNNRQFCSKCNVEYTWSLKRRYQLGYIRLVSPVTHLWYLKSSPSFIAVMLDMKRKDVEAITYCAETLTIDNAWKPGRHEVRQWSSFKGLSKQSFLISDNRELQNGLIRQTIKESFLKNNNFIKLTKLNFSITQPKIINSYLNHFKNSKISYDFWWRFFSIQTSISSNILRTKSGKFFPFSEFFLMRNQHLNNINLKKNRKNTDFIKKNRHKTQIAKKCIYNLKNIINFNKKIYKHMVYSNSTKYCLLNNFYFEIYSWHGINQNISVTTVRSLESIRLKKKYNFAKNWTYFLKSVQMEKQHKESLHSFDLKKIIQLNSLPITFSNQDQYEKIVIQNISNGLSKSYLDLHFKDELGEYPLFNNIKSFMQLNLTNKKFILVFSWKIFWDFAYKIAKLESSKHFKNCNDLIYKLYTNKLFLKRNMKFLIQNKKLSNSIRFYDFNTSKKVKFLKKKIYLNSEKKKNKLNNQFLNLTVNPHNKGYLQKRFYLRALRFNFCFNRISFKLFLLVTQYFFKKILNSFNNFSKQNRSIFSLNVLIKQKKKLLLALIRKIRIEMNCWKIFQKIIKLQNFVTKNNLNIIFNNKLLFVNLIKDLSKSLVESCTTQNFLRKQLPKSSNLTQLQELSPKKKGILYQENSTQVFPILRRNSMTVLSNIYKQLNYWYKEQLFLSKNPNNMKLTFSLKIEKAILILNFFLKFSIQNYLKNKSRISKFLKNKNFLNKNSLKNFLYQREVLFDRLLKLIQKYYFFKKLCFLIQSDEKGLNIFIDKMHLIQQKPSNYIGNFERCLDLFFEEIFKTSKLCQKKIQFLFKQHNGLPERATSQSFSLNKKLQLDQFSPINKINNLKIRKITEKKWPESQKSNKIALNLTISEILLIRKNKYFGSKKFIEVIKHKDFGREYGSFVNNKVISNIKIQKKFVQKRKNLCSAFFLSGRNISSKNQPSVYIPLSILIIKFYKSIILAKIPYETAEKLESRDNSNESTRSIFTEVLIVELNKIILRILLITNFFAKNNINKVKKQPSNFEIKHQKLYFLYKYSLNNINYNLKKQGIFFEKFNIKRELAIKTKFVYCFNLVLNSENKISTLLEANIFKKGLFRLSSVSGLFSLDVLSFFKKNFFHRFSISNWKNWIKILKLDILQCLLSTTLVKSYHFRNFFEKKLLLLNTNFEYINEIKKDKSDSNNKINFDHYHWYSKILSFCKLQKKSQIDLWKLVQLKKLLNFSKLQKKSFYQIDQSSFLSHNFMKQRSLKQLTIPLKTNLNKFFLMSRNYLLNINFCSESDLFNFKAYKNANLQFVSFYKKNLLNNKKYKWSRSIMNLKNCLFNNLNVIALNKTVFRIKVLKASVEPILNFCNFIFSTPFYISLNNNKSSRSLFGIKKISKKVITKIIKEILSLYVNELNFIEIKTHKPVSIKSSLNSLIEKKLTVFKAFTSSLPNVINSKECRWSEFLFNNIYCISHRYSWNIEMELHTFLNYINVPDNPYDVSIGVYGHRLMKSAVFREPPPVIGGGLIQKLLAEFNPTESKKIIQQITKQIRIVNGLLVKSSNNTESRTLRQKRTFLLRRLKYIRSVSYKFTENFFKLLKNNDDTLHKKTISLENNKKLEVEKQNFNLVKSPSNSSFLVDSYIKEDKSSVSLNTLNNFLVNVKKPSQITITDLLKRSLSHKDSLPNSNLSQYLKINNLRAVLKESRPEWMVLSFLPVLPPDLRPIIQIQNQVAASDLNRLYQKVIFRNERLKRFLKDSASSNSPQMKFAYRLLQEAVDNLIDNGKGKGSAETDNRGRPLKSLTELLKGKKGRFRQNLLGKRVDYSGRSVIVVGPRLRLHECGLPKEMALELFMPFLIQKIFKSGKASTILGAKKIIQNEPNQTWHFLTKVMRENPVLLNRAPTLHRLGFQSFQPKLVHGRAILLHPLVCPAFNADFDGDQMAVHVPITVEAKVEAWKIMLARNHLLSAATGEPMLVPSQDMVLGSYYLTVKNPKLYLEMGRGHSLFKTHNYFYNSMEEVVQSYQCHKIHLHSNIWLKWNQNFETDMSAEKLLEIQLNKNGQYRQIFNQFSRYLYNTGDLKVQYIQTTPGRVLFFSLLNLK
uniref:DNA-directed RNA polymerase subunit beta' n=1 Tax=Aphanochaete confervicola TaxID=764104 RepID=A0A6H1XEB7_9CHLO|nr:beta' subunit of RNA polymerase [Aphanochaete confervicola]QJA13858.1 beta' subunit of RNA polymerase [Aphanochaete confervicola]